MASIYGNRNSYTHIEPFGDPAPWAEPAWYNYLESPYYNDSHRRLRKYVRDYIETNVAPHTEEWEEMGDCPFEVRHGCS